MDAGTLFCVCTLDHILSSAVSSIRTILAAPKNPIKKRNTNNPAAFGAYAAPQLIAKPDLREKVSQSLHWSENESYRSSK